MTEPVRGWAGAELDDPPEGRDPDLVFVPDVEGVAAAWPEDPPTTWTPARAAARGCRPLVHDAAMDAMLAGLDAVTAEDVQRVAADVLGGRLHLAVIGPFDDPGRFERLLAG